MYRFFFLLKRFWPKTPKVKEVCSSLNKEKIWVLLYMLNNILNLFYFWPFSFTKAFFYASNLLESNKPYSRNLLVFLVLNDSLSRVISLPSWARVVPHTWLRFKVSQHRSLARTYLKSNPKTKGLRRGSCWSAIAQQAHVLT
jgi:hypothetical protein